MSLHIRDTWRVLSRGLGVTTVSYSSLNYWTDLVNDWSKSYPLFSGPHRPKFVYDMYSPLAIIRQFGKQPAGWPPSATLLISMSWLSMEWITTPFLSTAPIVSYCVFFARHGICTYIHTSEPREEVRSWCPRVVEATGRYSICLLPWDDRSAAAALDHRNGFWLAAGQAWLPVTTYIIWSTNHQWLNSIIVDICNVRVHGSSLINHNGPWIQSTIMHYVTGRIESTQQWVFV
jgi:hypothetical protein